MLEVPGGAEAVVVFVHGSGSSRHSPRNRFVASLLTREGIGTLLFDLLTRDEDTDYEKRFDIPLLMSRLRAVTGWLTAEAETGGLGVGYFGASTGSAAALGVAAELGPGIGAVVSRGGRPDMVEEALGRVQAPTLLIVGGYDNAVLELNRRAYRLIRAEKDLRVIPGATHLFEEPGALEEVARLAAEWFKKYLKPHKTSR
jgi:pimeloyl-ACP methyl ester carboxylesterase